MNKAGRPPLPDFEIYHKALALERCGQGWGGGGGAVAVAEEACAHGTGQFPGRFLKVCFFFFLIKLYFEIIDFYSVTETENAKTSILGENTCKSRLEKGCMQNA